MSEPFALGRLLIRSAILGSIVPVTQGEFWEVKAVQVVSALVICLVLYGLEKAVLWPFPTKLSIKPIHSAAYRGAVLYGLMTIAEFRDFYMALGACMAGALVAMGLFKLEEQIIRKLVERHGANTHKGTSSDK